MSRNATYLRRCPSCGCGTMRPRGNCGHCCRLKREAWERARDREKIEAALLDSLPAVLPSMPRRLTVRS